MDREPVLYNLLSIPHSCLCRQLTVPAGCMLFSHYSCILLLVFLSSKIDEDQVENMHILFTVEKRSCCIYLRHLFF